MKLSNVLIDKDSMDNENHSYNDIKFNIFKLLSVVLIASTISFFIKNSGQNDINIYSVFIFAVILISLLTANIICSTVSSLIFIFIFICFFTEKRCSFTEVFSNYTIFFIVLLLSALIVSGVTSNMKGKLNKFRKYLWQNNFLFETEALLVNGKNSSEIIKISANQLTKITDKPIIFFNIENDNLSVPIIFPSKNHETSDVNINKSDINMALKIYNNKEPVKPSKYINKKHEFVFLKVSTIKEIYGVIGIATLGQPINQFEYSLILSIIHKCALSLEKVFLEKKYEEVLVRSEKDQLCSNLLRSISHDLRTPLTSILGNAEILTDNNTILSAENTKQIYNDIYNDSVWVMNLVENLLTITRLENNEITLNMKPELLSDVIFEAINHINRRNHKHIIKFQEQDEMLIVKIDTQLIMQVIINIVENAIKYTPEGSEIIINLTKQGDDVILKIIDNGRGINDKEKTKIFNLFYTKQNNNTPKRQGLGIGLALCKSIITAHDGKILVYDNKPHGTIVEFNLKAEEVVLND